MTAPKTTAALRKRRPLARALGNAQRTVWLGLALAWAVALPDTMRAATATGWLQGGHAARISGVACSPDGTLVATASDDATIKLWSTNGTLLRTLSTQPYQATAVAFSPDGAQLAAGTYYGGFAPGNVFRAGYTNIPGLGLVYVWQAPGGWAAEVSLLRVLTNRYGKLTSLAFSADGARLASGNAAGSNYVNSVSSGAVLITRSGYHPATGPAAVTSVAFSPVGWLASGCEDGTVKVWDAAGNPLWTTNTAPASKVTAVAFSPTGGWLACARRDQTIQLWSTTNWTGLPALTGHTGGVTSVAFSPDGRRLVAGGLDGSLRLWDWAAGTCLATIAAHAAPVTATAFLPDGTRVTSGGEDSAVRIWSVPDGTLVKSLGSRQDYVGSVAISPDGTLCASAGGDPFILIHRAADGLLLRTLSGHTGGVSALAFTPDSAVLASSGGPREPTVKLWRLSDGAVLRTLAASTNGVMALAFSPDGATLASGGDFTEQTIRLWRVSDGTLARTLPGHAHGVTALAYAPRGDLLASGGRRFDHTVKLWAVTNGSLVRAFTGFSHNVEAVAFSPDGSAVAAGSSGTTPLKLWRLADGAGRDLGAGTNPVFAVAFSPDGSTLASADQDTIQLWDVASGTLSETLTREAFRVSCFAFSPNGNLLLYGREDATVALVGNTHGALGQPPLVFNSLTVNPDGTTRLEAVVQPRTHYVIQSATNLSDWTFLSLACSDTNVLGITGLPTSNAPVRFHRALTPP